MIQMQFTKEEVEVVNKILWSISIDAPHAKLLVALQDKFGTASTHSDILKNGVKK